MVLLKMNNHEHRTKQTYESYTFYPFMGFWFYAMVFLPLLSLKEFITNQLLDAGCYDIWNNQGFGNC